MDHVEERRDDLNFLEWSWLYDEIADSVIDGEMPPTNYTLIPSSRKFTGVERENLVRRLISTFNDSYKTLPNSEKHDDLHAQPFVFEDCGDSALEASHCAGYCDGFA